MTNVIDVPMTDEEIERKNQLEQIVRDGLHEFFKVGLALAEIREKSLYRDLFGNWSAYCQQVWGFSDRRALQLVGASSVISNLEYGKSKMGYSYPLPENESQVRSLVNLGITSQTYVWNLACFVGKTSGKDVFAISRMYETYPRLEWELRNGTITPRKMLEVINAYQSIKPHESDNNFYVHERLWELLVLDPAVILKISSLYNRNSATASEILTSGYLSTHDATIPADKLTIGTLQKELIVRANEHRKAGVTESLLKKGIEIIPINIYRNDPGKTAGMLINNLSPADREAVAKFLLSDLEEDD